jgi:hypothetical protein
MCCRINLYGMYFFCHENTEDRPTPSMSATASGEYPSSINCTARTRSSFAARRPFLAMRELSHISFKKSRKL